MKPVFIVLIVGAVLSVGLAIWCIVRAKRKNKECDTHCEGCPHAKECAENLAKLKKIQDKQDTNSPKD